MLARIFNRARQLGHWQGIAFAAAFGLALGCQTEQGPIVVDVECTFAVRPMPGIYRSELQFSVASTHLHEVRLLKIEDSTIPSFLDIGGPVTAANPGGQAVVYSAPLSLATAGIHRIVVRNPCTDTWFEYTYVIDQFGPLIVVSPESGIYRPPVEVFVSAPAADTLFARIYAAAETPPAFAAVTQTPFILPYDGTWQIDALAFDQAGNAATASVSYTVNGGAPIILELSTPQGLDTAARFPRFELFFDQPMSETTIVADAFTDALGLPLADAMLFWLTPTRLNVMPTEYLPGGASLYLDLSGLKNTVDQPIAQLFSDLSPKISFRTAGGPDQIETKFGTMTVTAPSLSGATTITAYVTVAPNPLSALGFLGVYATHSQDILRFLEPCENVFDGSACIASELVASAMDFARYRVQLTTDDWHPGRLTSLGLVAYAGNYTFVANDYLGVYVEPLTAVFSAENTAFVAIASEFLPTSRQTSNQIYFQFNTPPNPASFSANLTAEIQRGLEKIAATTTLDYLGETFGRTVRVTPVESLQHGDVVTYYLSAMAQNIFANALTAEIVRSVTYVSDATTPPRLTEASVSRSGFVRISQNTEFLSYLIEPGGYNIDEWTVTSERFGLELPILHQGAPNFPNRNGGPDIFSLHVSALVDSFPDGERLLSRAVLSRNGVTHTVETSLLVAPMATVKLAAEPLGRGAALRSAAGDIFTVGGGLQLSSSIAPGTVRLDFPDIVPSAGLTPASGSLYLQTNMTLKAAARDTEATEPSFDAGFVLGQFIVDNDNFGRRLTYVFPTTAAPVPSTSAASFGATEPIDLSWTANVTPQLNAFGIQVFPLTDTTGIPLLELRLPAAVTDATIPAQTLPAGSYEWFVYAIANLGDPFNLFSAPMLDIGYAVGVTATFSID